MIKKLLLVPFALFYFLSATAQIWIWFPGDMDIWMGNRIINMRTEDGGFFPVFWRMDSHWQSVEFSKVVDLPEAEDVEIITEGRYSVKIDKWYQQGMPRIVTIPKGKHTIKIAVSNITSPPSLWLKGKTINSDHTWIVSNYAENTTADTWYDTDGQPLFDTADRKPSEYRLPITEKAPISMERKGRELWVDFGREEMGYLRLNGIKGEGIINIFYGESVDEARNKKKAYVKEQRHTSEPDPSQSDQRTPIAMRYALIECPEGVSISDVTLLSEMKDLGQSYRGSFTCNDTLINRIWDVSAYTLHLTNREVMIEGIKRDRWMWSGDAIQSYLMNYYVFMDAPVVRRTIWALRGKDPVKQHINTILDYTFYWFNSVYDYYLYTGDADFVQRIYPRMQSLMTWVEGRLNSRGMIEGKKGDWVFVDWSPQKMAKNGELAFEQMVYLRSLEAMKLCAGIVHNKADEEKYNHLAKTLKSQLNPTFWDEKRKAFVHHVRPNALHKEHSPITRYANMFAVLYGYTDEAQCQNILHNVLLNDSVMAITTPYMRFYELEALCALGEYDYVLEEMRSYWGGMLKEGATTFWETYDPKEKYPKRLAMYGHPYGKSLCHAWGASPIYLLGKHYLGVQPIRPGYSEWKAEPHLGDLKWIKGDIPTPQGNIHIEMDKKQILIHASGCGGGTLFFSSKKKPKATQGTIESLGNNQYRLLVEPNVKVSVKYLNP